MNRDVAPVGRMFDPYVAETRETISGTPYYNQDAYQGYGQPICLYPENLMRSTEAGRRGAQYQEDRNYQQQFVIKEDLEAGKLC